MSDLYTQIGIIVNKVIYGLIALAVTLIAYIYNSDKKKISQLEKRMTEMETNYIDRFEAVNKNMSEVEKRIIEDYHKGKHEILGAMMSITKQMSEEREDNHRKFAPRESTADTLHEIRELFLNYMKVQ